MFIHFSVYVNRPLNSISPRPPRSKRARLNRTSSIYGDGRLAPAAQTDLHSAPTVSALWRICRCHTKVTKDPGRFAKKAVLTGAEPEYTEECSTTISSSHS